jgi:hypothetical protein
VFYLKREKTEKEGEMKKLFVLAGVLAIVFGFQASRALAEGYELYNGCKSTENNPCLRAGSCFNQASSWYTYVTIDRSDKLDTQNFSGLCDLMHMSLVQGKCEPLYSSRSDVISYLGSLSYAEIPSLYINRTLECGESGSRSTALRIKGQ